MKKFKMRMLMIIWKTELTIIISIKGKGIKEGLNRQIRMQLIRTEFLHHRTIRNRRRNNLDSLKKILQGIKPYTSNLRHRHLDQWLVEVVLDLQENRLLLKLNLKLLNKIKSNTRKNLARVQLLIWMTKIFQMKKNM